MKHKRSKETLGVTECISIQTYSSFEKLAAMQEEWDNFTESVDGGIFMTYDWLRVWWKYYGKKRALRIFVFRFNGSLVGILPVFLENFRFGPLRINAIKIVGIDFMPVTVYLPIKEKFIEQIIHLFINHLNSQFSYDLLYLGAICGLYKSLDKLLFSLKKNLPDFYHVENKKAGVQTYFKLYESFDKQIANLSKRERKKNAKNLQRA